MMIFSKAAFAFVFQLLSPVFAAGNPADVHVIDAFGKFAIKKSIAGIGFFEGVRRQLR